MNFTLPCTVSQYHNFGIPKNTPWDQYCISQWTPQSSGPLLRPQLPLKQITPPAGFWVGDLQWSGPAGLCICCAHWTHILGAISHTDLDCTSLLLVRHSEGNHLPHPSLKYLPLSIRRENHPLLFAIHGTSLTDAKRGAREPPLCKVIQTHQLYESQLCWTATHTLYFPQLLLKRKFSVCVSTNLHLEPLLQAHLSQQQEPGQLSKPLMCSSTCVLSAKLTMIKFSFKNYSAPNYPNSFYCNLPWPKAELMFRAAGLRKDELQELEAPAALWPCPAEGLQLPPHVPKAAVSHCHCWNLPAHLRWEALTVPPSTSGPCFHLKGCYTLPNKYRNEAALWTKNTLAATTQQNS